ncbi:ATP-binding cassette sub-family B member 9 [Rana temporaria]|uniref:ATP-binding cassette sub-family B member 9 n=1 Tax=Rana temporaria TaxID=8407 RepID=UPI001AAC6489|nr:ATP-binding cassette sub-family B member 9 [Rana temporaria]XP_040203254.1 ATP-binding cassette sub-family B member 9 [Rana temporaria]
MKPCNVMLCTLTFTLCDLTVSTVLYTYSCKKASIFEDVMQFNIFHSMLDVWMTTLLRTCVCVGAVIGVSWNRANGPQRLRASIMPMTLLCYLIASYAMIKLLLFSEEEKPIQDAWFWSLLSWTWLSSALTLFAWKQMGEFTSCRQETTMYSGLPDDQEVAQVGTQRTEVESDTSGSTIGRLLSYSKQDSGYLLIAFFFLILCTVGEIFSPYYTGLVIDGIVVQRSLKQFSSAVVILAVLAVGSSFSAGMRGGLFTFTFARLNIRIRNLLFHSLVSQEIGFFDENHTGDIISRLTSDTTIVSDVISENVNVFLRSVVKSVGVIVFMFSLSWQLSLLTFLGFPIIMLVSRVYGKYYKKLAKEVQTALAKANSTAEETISAIKTVRSFANEETEANVYSDKLHQLYSLYKKEAFAYTYYIWSTGFTELALQISILYYGGHLVISEQMTSGNLISFVIYEFLLGDCMESIGSVYGGLMQGVGAAEKVFEFIDRKPKMVNDGTLAPEHLEGKVDFRNITFSYPTRPRAQVLKNLSFTLYPGKITALVGPSGSGKSSCVNILENFYPVQEGEVLLDGHPITMYDHKYLHAKVSMVSQEPVLFARSIESNISYGLNSVPLEIVIGASKRASAHGFITELQDGYDTETGEKGAQLSGGQKQRVAIARSLIRNPRVLILDEATSALDAESEHAIQQAMNNDLQGRTVLIIAHRLSTVEKAHNIIVLDKGTVVQQGSHKELMEEGGLYSQLVQRQVSGLGSEEKDHMRSPRHQEEGTEK